MYHPGVNSLAGLPGLSLPCLLVVVEISLFVVVVVVVALFAVVVVVVSAIQYT